MRLFCFLPNYIAYDAAWAWQRARAAALRDDSQGEALALLEHEPVYTFGRHPRREHLLVDAEKLRLRGAPVVYSDRGGDITFHGPGQLVAYPILDLRARGLGPVDYVRGLEDVVIRTLDAFGVSGERVAGRPGVWVDGAKIAAIGVRVQGGISTHGLALNVDADLSWFDAIVPCGLSGVRVTSMERVLDLEPTSPPLSPSPSTERGKGERCLPTVSEVARVLIDAFEFVFDSELVRSPQPEKPDSIPQTASPLEALHMEATTLGR